MSLREKPTSMSLLRVFLSRPLGRALWQVFTVLALPYDSTSDSNFWSEWFYQCSREASPICNCTSSYLQPLGSGQLSAEPACIHHSPIKQPSSEARSSTKPAAPSSHPRKPLAAVSAGNLPGCEGLDIPGFAVVATAVFCSNLWCRLNKDWKRV